MKRLRSSDDLHSYGEKGVVKDWGRRDEESGLQRSTSSLHRSSYYKSSENVRKVLSSSTSRYDRLEDDREGSRSMRKRPDYDLENYERRKSYDRYREGNERGISCSSPRPGYVMDQMHRSESFSGPRRDFPKGVRSERDRPKREGIAASWRRFGGGKDGDDGFRSGTEGRGSKMESKEAGKANSPKGVRDVKSPAWSKDSGSEQSKSVEGKKFDDMPVESGGPDSDREEGELEPDPQPHVPLTKPAEGKSATRSTSPQKGHNECPTPVETASFREKPSFLPVGGGEMNRDSRSAKKAEANTKDFEDVPDKYPTLPDCQEMSVQGAGGSGNEIDKNGEKEGENDPVEDRRVGCLEEDTDSTSDEKLSSLPGQREDMGIDIKTKEDDIVVAGNLEIKQERDLPMTDKTTHILKDKGKSIVSLPLTSGQFTETNGEAENKPTDPATSGGIEMEGPSTWGFQFLSTDPIRKLEKVEEITNNKPKDDKLALELSLSLPNVLLPIGFQNTWQAPGSPSHARSVQSFGSSFRTNSDGFTASMSFSGSQQFTHNPSCSLTHNALDYEKSVGSKPLFQGVDWKALSAEENNNKEVPAYQGTSSKGNGFHQQSQFCIQGGVQNLRGSAGSSKLPIGLEKQLSFSKNLTEAQGSGSYSKDRMKVMTGKYIDSVQRSQDPDGKEQVPVVGADVAESIVTMIVSEPLTAVARRFSDTSGNHIIRVKEFVRDIISNPSKKWQLGTLQKALQKRPDLTLDLLLSAHRTQLEVLVALKTGLQEFVQQKCDIPSSDLAEIFLNMRCKNLKCRTLLPVDECDCKICSQRSDFCRECMCLVCSKFDMASNTCSWVGCDVCLHWCHADCGLRESHIRNGRSATGAQGSTEMQFYCVACDHPSEMFGFVKEVFQNFVKEWTAQNLSRELEYVRRIFCAGEDVRGKQLHDIAVGMLSKLANSADLLEVQNHIMSFFAETSYPDMPSSIPVEPRKEMPSRNLEKGNGIAASSQGAGWMKSVYSDKALHLENPVSLLPSFDSNGNDKYGMGNLDIRKTSQKGGGAMYDELESIVRIKQAEAKMFQGRADDARRESEDLQCILVAKSERIEEEYTGRISKLRLAESEEMKKQKVEELQSLERAYQDYFNMKMRMETEIKDLLLKMEATRRNLGT